MTKFEKIEKAFWRLAKDPDANLLFDRDFIMNIYKNKNLVGKLEMHIKRSYTIDTYSIRFYVKDLDTGYAFDETEQVSPKTYANCKEKFQKTYKEAKEKWEEKRNTILNKLAGI